MAVDFSIKQVPDRIARRLRERARQHHRSLQGELRAILEEAAGDRPAPVSVQQVYERARSLGHVDTGESIVDLIRRMRDERGEHLVQVIESPARKGRRS